MWRGIIEFLSRVWAFAATWLWARKQVQNEVEKINAKAVQKDAEEWVNAPATPIDFHKRMRERIKRKN